MEEIEEFDLKKRYLISLLDIRFLNIDLDLFLPDALLWMNLSGREIFNQLLSGEIFDLKL